MEEMKLYNNNNGEDSWNKKLNEQVSFPLLSQPNIMQHVGWEMGMVVPPLGHVGELVGVDHEEDENGVDDHAPP